MQARGTEHRSLNAFGPTEFSGLRPRARKRQPNLCTLDTLHNPAKCLIGLALMRLRAISAGVEPDRGRGTPILPGPRRLRVSSASAASAWLAPLAAGQWAATRRP